MDSWSVVKGNTDQEKPKSSSDFKRCLRFTFGYELMFPEAREDVQHELVLLEDGLDEARRREFRETLARTVTTDLDWLGSTGDIEIWLDNNQDELEWRAAALGWTGSWARYCLSGRPLPDVLEAIERTEWTELLLALAKKRDARAEPDRDCPEPCETTRPMQSVYEITKQVRSARRRLADLRAKATGYDWLMNRLVARLQVKVQESRLRSSRARELVHAVESESVAKLLGLGPTQDIEVSVAETQTRLDTLGELDPSREAAEEMLQRERVRLALAGRRDELQILRPQDCWCLGEGARTSPGRLSFCGCPDGVARRSEHYETVRREELAAADRRVESFNTELPRHFSNLTLASYPTSEPAQEITVGQVRSFVDDQGPNVGEGKKRRPWMLLWGPVGTGKTGLALGAAKELLQAGNRNALFISTADFLERLRRSYDTGAAESEAEILDAVRDTEVLVLDDVGAEKPTDWAAERLFSVLNHRYGQELVTIMTTNLKPTALVGRVRERIMDRIGEMSHIVSVNKCPNLRRPGAASPGSPANEPLS